MAPIKSAIIVGSASWLLGIFFVYWSVDHNILWARPLQAEAVKAAYNYYSDIASNIPQAHVLAVSLCVMTGIVACLAQLAEGGPGMVFDAASLFLYLVMVGMWTAYELPDRAALAATPLDAKELAGIAVDSSTLESLLQASPSLLAPCVEILKKLASAHTMIAVTLTGVVSLQAGRHYSTD